MIVTGGIPRYGAINQSHALARGLFAMLRGGVAMGNETVWYDLARNNRVLWTATPTWRQNWVELNGTTQYGSFSGTENIAITTAPLSIHVIARIATFATSSFQELITLKSNGTDAITFGLSDSASYLGMFFGSNATWARCKTDYPSASLVGFDRHFVVTYNGAGATTMGNFRAYTDGVEVTLAAAGAFGATTNASKLGAHGNNTSLFNGRIYRAGIWNRELTASEAKMLFLRPDAMFNQVETPIFGGGRLITRNLLHGRFGGLLRGKF